jgi:hypothetical protein
MWLDGPYGNPVFGCHGYSCVAGNKRGKCGGRLRARHVVRITIRMIRMKK